MSIVQKRTSMQAGCSHNWEEPNIFITCPLIRISTGSFIHSQGFYGDTWLHWFCKNLCWKNQTLHYIVLIRIFTGSLAKVSMEAHGYVDLQKPTPTRVRCSHNWKIPNLFIKCPLIWISIGSFIHSQGFYGDTWLYWFCKNLHWLSADVATIGKYQTSLLHACRKRWTEVSCHFANPASWKPLMYMEDLCSLLQILAEGGHCVQWRKEDDRNIVSIFLWSSVYKPLLVVQK